MEAAALSKTYADLGKKFMIDGYNASNHQLKNFKISKQISFQHDEAANVNFETIKGCNGIFCVTPMSKS